MKIVMPTGDIADNKTPQWKTPWNHDTNFESDRTAIYCADPSLTKQEFKEDADINVIIDRVMKGGDLPPPVLPEHFADLSERQTYFDIATRLAEANKTFYLLDAELRAQHLNDPTQWADAVLKATQQGNKQALRDLGLDVPEPPETAQAGKTPATGTPEPPAPEKPSQGPKGAPTSDTGK